MSDEPYQTARAVLNCGQSGQVRFEFVCPQTWLELAPGDDPRKRFCEACERDVYWCTNAPEAGLRAEQGECIAVPGWLAETIAGDAQHQRDRIMVGRVASPTHRIEQVVRARLGEDDALE